MDFITAIKTCISKYVDFNGRARRSEFWYWELFTLIVGVVAGWIPFVGNLLNLAIILPTLAVGARRLHDTDRSGWWLLMSVVPGIIVGILAIALFGSAFLGIIAGTINPDAIADIVVSNVGLLVAYLISILAAVICSIILIIWWASDSTPGTNKYGENPKGV